MSETVPASRVREVLGFDPVALRRIYRRERDRRVRPEGTSQYVSTAAAFADYAADPVSGPEVERAPLTDDVDVLVVGGGFSGLVTAAEMRKRAGVDRIRIVDKAADFGGAWYWNRYPGLRCDTEAYVYLPLLEDVGVMPSEKYTRGIENQEYCRAIGRHFDLYRDALFRTQVTGLRWDEARARWVVTTDRGDEMTARFVCLGSGPLNHPKLPGIPGIDTFRGHAFHTSRWDYDYTGGDTYGGLTKLADKDVALIGTGATAVQCVPYLAEAARSLTVFQRTPTSVDVRANRPTDPDWFAGLEPGWQRRRIANFGALVSGREADEDLVADRWTEIVTLNRRVAELFPEAAPAERAQLANFLKMERIRARVDDVVEDPETAAALKPWYDYWCKRPLFSDEYLQAFNRDSVTLVDTRGGGVDRIVPDGVEFDGRTYPADLLVFATGFEFGAPPHEAGGFDLVGRGGVTLAERWADGVRTLHGILVRGFPNLFVVGGLAQGQVTANFTHMMGVQAAHVAEIVARSSVEDVESVEVRPEAEQAWLQTIREKAVDRSAFERECTPSYLNFEGDLSRRSGANAAYGGGPFEYEDVLQDWLGTRFTADLELQHRASTSENS